MVRNFSSIILLLSSLAGSCTAGPTDSELPEIERGISLQRAKKFLGIARIKATESGYKLEDINYSVRRVKTLYVPYHSEFILEQLSEAVRRKNELFEVMFYRKPLKNGGAIWGGGFSVYMNQKGEIVDVERGM